MTEEQAEQPYDYTKLPDLTTAKIEIPGREPQVAEAPTQEVTTESNEEVTTQPVEESAEGATKEVAENEGGETVETPVEEPVSEGVDDETYFKALTEETGIQVSSDKDIVNTLKENAQLKQELEKFKADPFEGYDPLVKDIASATKAGMDIQTYMSARTLDVDSLDTKAALYQKFKLDNAENIKQNPTFYQKKFEREFAAKYGKIDSQISEEDFDDNNSYQNALEDLEFTKAALENDVLVAKQDLKQWQKDNITIKQEEAPVEDVKERLEAYHSEVAKTLESTKGLQLPIGDENFTFDLGNDGLEAVREGLMNPQNALKEIIGIDLETGVIDTNKLSKILVYSAASNNNKLGDQLKKFAIEQYNKETIEGKMENSHKAEALGSAPETKTMQQKVAEAFASQRKY